MTSVEANPSQASAEEATDPTETASANAGGAAAETPSADAGGAATESESADAGGAATQSESADAGRAAADTANAPQTAAADVDGAGTDAQAGDAADTEAGLATADPSPNAAVGASGARPLGDAEEVADRVADAVDRMNDAADGAGEGGRATTDGSTNGATAAVATAETDIAEGSGDGGNGAVTPDEVSAAPPAAPARAFDGPEPTTMEELLNEQATEIRSLKHGDVVEGTVVRIDKDEILVDIGAKSEGVISNRELYGRNAETQPELNIGDVVLVYVLQPESPEGHAVLSLRRAGLERKWRAMQEQLDAGEIIEAPVIDHNKGGLIVDCGIRGFVPISQIVDFPRRPQNEQPRDAAQEIAEKLQPYVGRRLRLKILEVNRKANRLILSEKVALYEERREKRDELFSSLQVGQKVTGTVRSIAPFGVFIDLGGIDGLVHKSELSWNKVNNPEAGYRVGEEVEAEVIDINHERGRISLSIRRLQPDPWHSTVADLKVGDVIDGTVTKIVNFGAFVRVRDGLEGLIHISELSHQRVAHPGDVVHEGQTLKLKIISLDQERHRLGLSLKQAEEAPARTEAPARRERRPREERGFDMSQAVQEPEGGIDNTLAAAFAQVRQQMEETEAARTPAEPAADAAAETDADTSAVDAASDQPQTTGDSPEAVLPEQPEPSPTGAQTEAAPALDVAAADDLAGRPAEAAAAADMNDRTESVDGAGEGATDEAAAGESPDEPAEGRVDTGVPAADTEDLESTAGDGATDAAAAGESPVEPAEGASDGAPDDGADTESPTR